MVRNFKRKTKRGLYNVNDMKEAIEMVEKGVPVRQAAAEKNVNFGTLYRYIKIKQNCSSDEDLNLLLVSNYGFGRVFSKAQEKILKEYFLQHSFNTLEARKLAYEIAKHYKLKIPLSWQQRAIAGADWLYCFRQRNPGLTLRKPRPGGLLKVTSIASDDVHLFEEFLRENFNDGDGSIPKSFDKIGIVTYKEPKTQLKNKRLKLKIKSSMEDPLIEQSNQVSYLSTASDSDTLTFKLKEEIFEEEYLDEVDGDITESYSNSNTPVCMSYETLDNPDSNESKHLVTEHESNKKENLNDVFGRLVSMKLKKLPHVQRALAERIINETLFLADLGSLTMSHGVKE